MKNRIVKILNTALKVCVIALLVRLFFKEKSSKPSTGDKMTVYYHLLDKWMKLREEEKYISDYMEKHGFKTIAIYGLGDIGRHLEKELENSKTQVLYAINKEARYFAVDLDVYSPESELPPVDAVIVTPVMDYGNICKALKGKVSCPILSIVDVINELSGV